MWNEVAGTWDTHRELENLGNMLVGTEDLGGLDVGERTFLTEI
jgi:hypothetical protein